MTRRDWQGRRYIEVRPFEDGPVKQALAALPEANHRCVQCGVPLVHGTDRYFQRTDGTDGQDGRSWRARVRLALTYDPVCGPCGDEILSAMPRQ